MLKIRDIVFCFGILTRKTKVYILNLLFSSLSYGWLAYVEPNPSPVCAIVVYKLMTSNHQSSHTSEKQAMIVDCQRKQVNFPEKVAIAVAITVYTVFLYCFVWQFEVYSKRYLTMTAYAVENLTERNLFVFFICIAQD